MSAAPTVRTSAEVVWFDEAKGWGIAQDEGGRELLVDYAAIAGDGFRTLRPGQRVDLDIVETPAGPTAGRVVPRA